MAAQMLAPYRLVDVAPLLVDFPSAEVGADGLVLFGDELPDLQERAGAGLEQKTRSLLQTAVLRFSVCDDLLVLEIGSFHFPGDFEFQVASQNKRGSQNTPAREIVDDGS